MTFHLNGTHGFFHSSAHIAQTIDFCKHMPNACNGCIAVKQSDGMEILWLSFIYTACIWRADNDRCNWTKLSIKDQFPNFTNENKMGRFIRTICKTYTPKTSNWLSNLTGKASHGRQHTRRQLTQH
jgi:hypothetical protein